MNEAEWRPDGPTRGPKERRAPTADPEHPEEELYTVPRFSAGDRGRSCYLLGRRLAAITVRPGSIDLEIRSMEGSLALEVSGPCRLSRGDVSDAMDPSRPAGIAPLLARITEGVERIRVDREGNLRVEFSDDARLTVPGNAFQPTWTVQGAGDLEAARAFFRV